MNAITEYNGKVIFTKEKVIIEKNEKKILEGNKMSNGLYEVNLVSLLIEYFSILHHTLCHLPGIEILHLLKLEVARLYVFQKQIFSM